MALPGQQRLVDRAFTLAHQPVRRDALPRPEHEEIADREGFGRDLDVAPVAPHPRPLRAKLAQRADGSRRLALGARLQPFAQQHQRRDHRRRLEIEMLHPRAQQRLNRAQAIGRRGADRDQRVHGRRAMPSGLPGGRVEPPAEQELNGRRQGELRPAVEHPMQAEQIADHGGGQGQAQRGRRDHHPKPRRRGFRRPVDRRLFQDRRRVIAGAFDGGGQSGHCGSRSRPWPRSRPCNRDLDPRALRRQIDLGGGHARRRGERLLHPRHAGCAGHPSNGDVERRGLGHDASLLLDAPADKVSHHGKVKPGKIPDQKIRERP